MKQRLIIVGAGAAGLLAANMLRRHNPVIVEEQPSLPHNHSAVLRFRSSIIGDVLGIEFKKVNLLKAVLPWKNPIADAMAYSAKNLGSYEADRSLTYEQTSTVRYIAPPDLIERMAEGIDIRFGQRYNFYEANGKVLSTIPMPVLMSALSYSKRVPFRSVGGVNILATIRDANVYASLIVPNPGYPYSRISITGNELIVECPRAAENELDIEFLARVCANHVGIDEGDVTNIRVKRQDYAKIAPIDEAERRAFIYWASTVKGRAWQLGRFATWRPRLLMDDLVNDVRKIERWMRSKSAEADMELEEARA